MTHDQIVASSVEIKGRPGIYFLIEEDEIVYVGKTENCSSRLHAHSMEKGFSRFYFMAIDDASQLDDLERFYIDKFKPALNKTRVWASILPKLEFDGTPLERAMMRVRMGQPAYSSAKAEGVHSSTLYASKAYREYKDEANQHLLHRRNARAA